MKKTEKPKNPRFLSALLSLLLAVVLIAVLPTDAEAMIYEDTLRLHILANSDSEEDQALKLRIRDRVLEKYSTLFSDSAGIADAGARADASLEEIRADCEMWAAEEGYPYPVYASYGVEWYDTRDYGGFSLPKGYYRSLRIVIGDGAGHNWWCVMYPPMCLDLSVDETASYTPEEKSLIAGEYRVRFKTLEIFSELFGEKG